MLHVRFPIITGQHEISFQTEETGLHTFASTRLVITSVRPLIVRFISLLDIHCPLFPIAAVDELYIRVDAPVGIPSIPGNMGPPRSPPKGEPPNIGPPKGSCIPLNGDWPKGPPERPKGPDRKNGSSKGERWKGVPAKKGSLSNAAWRSPKRVLKSTKGSVKWNGRALPKGERKKGSFANEKGSSPNVEGWWPKSPLGSEGGGQTPCLS